VEFGTVLDKMKLILALFIFFAAGCTSLLVENPIGSDFTPEQLSDFEGSWFISNKGDFEGSWFISNKGDISQIIDLKKIDNIGTFKTASIEWNDDEKTFDLDEGKVILKKGNKYGILHIMDDEFQKSERKYLLITLFKTREDQKIESWLPSNKSIKEFLSSGALKTENVDGDIVITDKPQRIIDELESNFQLIFDQESSVTLTKIK